MVLLVKPVLEISNRCKATTDTLKTKEGNDGLVKGLCKQGRLRESLRILQDMVENGIWPYSSTYDSLLQGCLNAKSLPDAKLVHAHMIQTQFECQDISLGNKLVSIYVKLGSLIEARRVFDEMPLKNVVSWTAMIAAYARHEHAQEALGFFYEMQDMGLQPNHFTFSSIIPACTDLEVLREVHGEIRKGGFETNVFVGNGLVDMYAKHGFIEFARELFDKMPQRDVVSWNAMIAGYVQNGLVGDALKLFQEMPKRDVISWNTMIAGYAQCGDVENAVELFEKMPGHNLVSWNTMIAGYVQNGYVKEAFELFQIMPERNVISWNAVISGFAQNGQVEEALNLFKTMPESNVVSWNAMIGGYSQNGQAENALKLFGQMQMVNIKPNTETFVIVLPACSALAALERGSEAHEVVIRSGFHSDVLVGNTLVGMYAKCGSTEDARKVFNRMRQQDTASWSAMIVGYAINGCAKESLELFEQMQFTSTKPDRVTFVGVLSACCHAGLVDEGRQYFDIMTRFYHITPAMEHYGCMIDLLGRAGCLDEANDLINKMPFKPDADMWGSFLSACRTHNNIDLGEKAAQHLIELNPQNPAPYVLLSNIYAAAGRWDDIGIVRNRMKERKVKKKPGCSWIVINKQVHAFLVGG